MAQTRDPAERRRRAILAAVAIMVMVGAGVMTALAEHAGALRSVDIVKVGMLIVLALVLGLRSTTSFTLTTRNPVLDDELTRANRASAARAGYWALMLGAALAFVCGVLTDIKVTEVAPLLLAMGAAGAGIRFAILEARGDG
jgi:hypothetical protein